MIEWFRELRGLFNRLRDIHGLLMIINWRTARMAGELELLQTEVAETRAAVNIAIAAVADLRVKLDAAIASGNPAALVALAADLDKMQADLAAAVSPTVNEPPVEPPVA